MTHPTPPPGSLRHLKVALLRRRWRWLAGCLLVFALQSCGESGAGGGDRPDQPSVLATNTIIADWAEQVGGDEIALTSLLQAGDDPHVYEPVPKDTVAMEEADLILYNGYNLEPALIRLAETAGANAEKLALGEVVEPLQEAGSSVPDPHVWGDVQNAIAMTNAVRDALIALSPEDEAVFTQNAAAYTATLEQLDRWIGEQIATIPAEQRRLVTTHDAFQYYANAYALEVLGTLIGISTEEQPSAQTVQRLVESIKSANVPVIFAETTLNPDLIQTVAEEAQVALSPQKLYSDSIGAPGSEGDSYIKMMVSNTQAIVEALGGSYTPFQMPGS